MENKNNTLIIIVVIIVIALATLIVIKNKNAGTPVETSAVTQTEIEFTKSISNNSDTTQSINASLNNIDLADTSNEDLQAVDQELRNF